MSLNDFNSRLNIDPDAYQRSSARQRNCELTGGHTWIDGHGYQGNGIKQYVRACTNCTARTNLPRQGNQHCDNGPTIYDNRPPCCAGRGCQQCNPNPCEHCGAHTNTQLHHWAPKHLFGWEEAEQWPTSWLCPPCHTQWHRTVTPHMNRRTA